MTEINNNITRITEEAGEEKANEDLGLNHITNTAEQNSVISNEVTSENNEIVVQGNQVRQQVSVRRPIPSGTAIEYPKERKLFDYSKNSSEDNPKKGCIPKHFGIFYKAVHIMGENPSEDDVIANKIAKTYGILKTRQEYLESVAGYAGIIIGPLLTILQAIQKGFSPETQIHKDIDYATLVIPILLAVISYIIKHLRYKTDAHLVCALDALTQLNVNTACLSANVNFSSIKPHTPRSKKHTNNTSPMPVTTTYDQGNNSDYTALSSNGTARYDEENQCSSDRMTPFRMTIIEYPKKKYFYCLNHSFKTFSMFNTVICNIKNEDQKSRVIEDLSNSIGILKARQVQLESATEYVSIIIGMLLSILQVIQRDYSHESQRYKDLDYATLIIPIFLAITSYIIKNQHHRTGVYFDDAIEALTHLGVDTENVRTNVNLRLR